MNQLLAGRDQECNDAGNVITHEHAGEFTDANRRFFLQLPVSFTGFRCLVAVENFVIPLLVRRMGITTGQWHR